MNDRVNENHDLVLAFPEINKVVVESDKLNIGEIVVSPEINEQEPKNIVSNLNEPNLLQCNIQANLQQEGIKRKNKVLQFLKFLLFSIKIEVKNNEFLLLIKHSSSIEIIIWLVSIILYIDSIAQSNYVIIWFHVIHFIRGIIGKIILRRIPMTYDFIERLNVDDKIHETKLFNDILRDTIKAEALPQLRDIQGWLISYFSLTIINVFIDVIYFLYCLSNLAAKSKIIDLYFLFFFTISVIYFGIPYLLIFRYRHCLFFMD